MSRTPETVVVVAPDGTITEPTVNATTLALALDGKLDRVFSSGGALEVGASTGYAHSSANGTGFNDYTDTVTAQWTQPLRRGAGKSIVLAREEEAAISRDAATLARRQAAIGEVRDVVQNYWELLYAQRDLEIRHSSLELARERLRRTQAGISGGGLARTEALAVQQVIATREEEVLASELGLVDQSITLRRLVGMEIGPHQLALSSTGELGVPSQSWNLDTLVDEAYKTSPELAQLVAQGKNATIEVEVDDNGVMPSLDLGLNGAITGDDDGPLSAAKNLVTANQYQAGATLTYRASLGHHAALGVAREARAQCRSSRSTRSTPAPRSPRRSPGGAARRDRAQAHRSRRPRRSISRSRTSSPSSRASSSASRPTSTCSSVRTSSRRRSCARRARWSTGTRPPP